MKDRWNFERIIIIILIFAYFVQRGVITDYIGMTQTICHLKIVCRENVMKEMYEARTFFALTVEKVSSGIFSDAKIPKGCWSVRSPIPPRKC